MYRRRTSCSAECSRDVRIDPRRGTHRGLICGTFEQPNQFGDHCLTDMWLRRTGGAVVSSVRGGAVMTMLTVSAPWHLLTAPRTKPRYGGAVTGGIPLSPGDSFGPRCRRRHNSSK